MKIGLCTISDKEARVEDILETAAEVGYDGVEVWGEEPHVGDGSSADCEAITGTAEAVGLDVAVYGSYLAPGTGSFEGSYEHELDVAERLGADLIRVWPGDSEYGDHAETEWEAAVSDLSTLAEAASSRGLEVTVEKHAGRLSNATEGARRLIEAVDHPACGLNYQPHFHMSEDELVSEAEILAPLSNNIHIQAPAERGSNTRALLAESYFDVGAVLAPFDDAGFEGYVEVEFVTDELPYEEAVARDYEFLRSIVRGEGTA